MKLSEVSGKNPLDKKVPEVSASRSCSGEHVIQSSAASPGWPRTKQYEMSTMVDVVQDVVHRPTLLRGFFFFFLLNVA